ncbi:hypothetical protein NBRC116590_02740 [Pelagimonas sp. KU-00592-HH]|uniref:hypothetical protein n=1 Tax=Pelagimonas sp. KU-00592-HH TaxID=3127651 RepID=UPI003105CBF7
MGGSIKSTLHIAPGAPATINQAGFEALTFTEVGSIASIGERGDTHSDIERPADLKTGRKKSLKGAVSGGNFPVTCHTEDFADAGQDAVRTACAAFGSSADYSIKVLNPAGDAEYYTGYLRDFRRSEKSETSHEGCAFVMVSNEEPVIVEA